MTTPISKVTGTKLYSYYWLVIIAVPWLLISIHFHEISKSRQESNQKLIEDSLLMEMKSYQRSLSGKMIVESVMREVEKELGLTIQKNDLDFFSEEDPGFYNSSTPEKISEIVFKNLGIRPAYILALDFEARNVFEMFEEKDFPFSQRARKILKAQIAWHIVERLKPPGYNYPPPLYEHLKIFDDDKSKIMDCGANWVNNVLRLFFSGLANFPKAPGICLESCTSRSSGNQFFFYTNGIMNRGRFYGGFFIAFSGAEMGPEFLLKQSAGLSGGIFKRSLESYSPEKIGRFSFKDGKLNYFENLPPEFTNCFFKITYKGPRLKTLRYCMKVSVEPAIFFADHLFFQRSLSFFQKIFFLALFFLFVHQSLFSSKITLGLRSKFFAVTSLIILIPFLAMAYFSGLLLTNLESLNSRKLEIEAAAKMFEVSRFVDDSRLKRFLSASQAKKVFCDNVSGVEGEFDKAEIFEKLPATLVEDVSLVSRSGSSMIFSRNSKSKEPRKMTTLLGVSYLNKLGVFDLTLEKNRRQLELVNFTGGFLASLAMNYSEGLALAQESQETKDLSELNDLHKMIYFLIPGIASDNRTVAAIGFWHFFAITRYGRLFDRIGQKPDLLLNSQNEFASQKFALAEREFEGPPEKYFPTGLQEKDSLRLLINQAIETKSSGSSRKDTENENLIYSWQFFPSQEIVISGVTTSRPDLFLKFISTLFPFLTGLFSLISLSLISDFMAEFLVRPISYFLEFIGRVKMQDFSCRIETEDSDEYSLMADSFNLMAEGLTKREKLKRFVSKKLFETIEEDLNLTDSMAKHSEMTVLASDIRGFTSLTEKNDPAEIVSLLNEYFTLMGKAISQNGGIVERFVGDAIIAVFYPETTGGGHALAAARAAVSMRRFLAELNRKRAEENKFEIENGIGLVTQKGITAISGATKGRKVFSVMGNIIEKAEKLEAITAKLPDGKIVVCPRTADKCREIFKTEKLAEFPEAFRLRYEN
ncbi:MAG: adenylate/guanylate cyclase domain-containing protein [Candidatus Rifleibacteriota bacterium]